MQMAPDQRTTVDLEQELAAVRQELEAANDRCARLEETLREKEDLLTFVIKYNPNAIAVFDHNLHYMLVSDRYRQDYGLGDTPVIGRHHYDVFPEMPQVWRDVHTRCMAGATEFSEDDSFVREDGSITYNRWDCRPWYDAQGEIGGLTIFTEVTTDRKQAEQQLRMAQTALDQLTDGVQWIRRDGLITYSNDTMCHMLGYSREEILQMRVADFDPNFPPEAWEPTWNRVKEVGVLNFETLHRHKEGSIYPADVTVNYLDFNGQEYLFAIVRDITERKQAEERLQTFKALADNAPDAIGVATLDGTIFYANPAYQAMQDNDNLVGMNVAETLAPESLETIVPHIFQGLEEHGIWRGVVMAQRRDGSTFPVQESAFNIYNQDGQVIATSAIMRDITEQRRAEAVQQRLVAVVENNNDFIGMVTLQGEPVYLNPAGLRMVGLSPDELVQTTMLEYVAPDERDWFAREVLPVIMQEGFWHGELHFRNFQTDALIPSDYNAFLVRNPQTGEQLGIACVARDISDQKRAEAERTALQEQVIEAQRAAIRELSTPLMPLADGVVAIPLVGTIDSGRAQQIMETLLDGVSQHQARVAILDITGVQVVDTQIANTLVQAAQAVRLLGASVVITGIRPDVAQTLVHLGVDLGHIVTRGSLQGGIAYALDV
jgi:rsbT co-antagonist protein RsbR